MKHKGIRLLHKFLYGKPNLEEKARIDKWYEEIENGAIADPDELQQVKDQIYERTRAELNAGVSVIPLYKRPFFRIAAAAVVVAFIAGTYFLFFNKSKPDTIVADRHQQPLTNDVAPPAGNKAILTLADGTTIVLDSARNGSLAQQGNATVAKLNDGKIAYNTGTSNDNEIHYNTLKVPKGSKPVQLILSDGSEVWLNVASSITYPTAFTGNERKVEITGEVYFEVTRNEAMPFKVRKEDLEVQVLGTHFNVNAYDDESSLKVTLLEGVVNVGQQGRGSQVIKPGQQAVIRQAQVDNKIKVINNVDIDEVMAWKNGWFNFNSLQMVDIMRQIEKWYDVEVTYQGKPSQKHFSGMVSRNNNVSEVLKIMEQVGIRFKIEGKKIMVI